MTIKEEKIEPDDEYKVEDFIEHAGFGKFQWLMIGLCGFYWAADAMVMLFYKICLFF
jgi:hypothetical protein